MKVLIFKLQTFERYSVCTLHFIILYFWLTNLMCMWHAGCYLLNCFFIYIYVLLLQLLTQTHSWLPIALFQCGMIMKLCRFWAEALQLLLKSCHCFGSHTELYLNLPPEVTRVDPPQNTTPWGTSKSFEIVLAWAASPAFTYFVFLWRIWEEIKASVIQVNSTTYMYWCTWISA